MRLSGKGSMLEAVDIRELLVRRTIGDLCWAGPVGLPPSPQLRKSCHCALSMGVNGIQGHASCQHELFVQL